MRTRLRLPARAVLRYPARGLSSARNLALVDVAMKLVIACLAATASALVAPAAFSTKAQVRQIATAPQMVRFRVRNGLNRGDRRPFFGWLLFSL